MKTPSPSIPLSHSPLPSLWQSWCSRLHPSSQICSVHTLRIFSPSHLFYTPVGSSVRHSAPCFFTLQLIDLSSFGYTLRSGAAGPYGNSILDFFEESLLFSIATIPFYIHCGSVLNLLSLHSPIYKYE